MECSRFVPHLVVVDVVLIVVVVVVFVVVVVGVVAIVIAVVVGVVAIVVAVVVAVVVGVDVIVVVVVVVTSIGLCVYHRLPAMMNYSCDVIVLSHSATHQHRAFRATAQELPPLKNAPRGFHCLRQVALQRSAFYI